MTDTTVTIGLPVYNAETTLMSAVASVFAQTHEDWLLYIVDDGSSDNSLEIARSICDSRVTVIADQANRGLGARLNQLAEIAPTQLLFRMDSDDIMHPRRLEVLIARIQARPNLAMLGSRAYMIDEQNTILGAFKEPDVGETVRDWLGGCGLTHPTVVTRTDWLRANPYDASLSGGEDLEIWTRTAGRAEVAKVDEFLLYYRVSQRVNLPYYDFIQRAYRHVVDLQDKTTVPWPLRTRLKAISVLKQITARGLVAAHLDRAWQARRAAPLSEQELALARADLGEALAACVPTR